MVDYDINNDLSGIKGMLGVGDPLEKGFEQQEIGRLGGHTVKAFPEGAIFLPSAEDKPPEFTLPDNLPGLAGIATNISYEETSGNEILGRLPSDHVFTAILPGGDVAYLAKSEEEGAEILDHPPSKIEQAEVSRPQIPVESGQEKRSGLYATILKIIAVIKKYVSQLFSSWGAGKQERAANETVKLGNIETVQSFKGATLDVTPESAMGYAQDMAKAGPSQFEIDVTRCTLKVGERLFDSDKMDENLGEEERKEKYRGEVYQAIEERFKEQSSFITSLCSQGIMASSMKSAWEELLKSVGESLELEPTILLMHKQEVFSSPIYEVRKENANLVIETKMVYTPVALKDPSTPIGYLPVTQKISLPLNQVSTKDELKTLSLEQLLKKTGLQVEAIAHRVYTDPEEVKRLYNSWL